jgi:hypothetical protein
MTKKEKDKLTAATSGMDYLEANLIAVSVVADIRVVAK